MTARLLHLLRLHFIFVFTVICLFTAKATGDGWKADFGDVKCFIENKGQFKIGNDGSTTKQVKFAFDGHNERYLFTSKGVVFELIEKERIPKTKEQRAERKAKKAKGFDNYDDFLQMEKEWRRVKDERDYLYAEWIGANPNPEIVTEERNTYHHSYCLNDISGKEINLNNIPSYQKLIYKNIYPNIDVVYEFHSEKGLKYSLVVRPGGDISKIKLKYSKEASLTNNIITTPTKFGNIIDHSPFTFYKGNNGAIRSNYILNDNVISFEIENYDQNKTIVIDPWTQTPDFPSTQWDCVWECERDGAGNVYVIGGTTPLELRKYNSAGVQQWIYNTTYDSTEWLGSFATSDAGVSYVSNGSVAKMRSVSTAGATVWANNSPSGVGLSGEFWNITFNCDQTQLVIAGTGGAIPPQPYIYRMNMSNGNVTNSIQVHAGALMPTQEVRSITPCNNGKYYFLTHDSIGYIHQSLQPCGTSSNTIFHASNGSALGYKCENWRYNNSGIMALAHYNGFVYVHRGNQLQKRNFATAAIVGTVNIPGGSFTSGFGGSQVGCSGIDIDNCGNIYVGSTNGVYKFDQTLTQQASYPTSFVVYDVEVNTGGDIIAGGSTGNSSSGARTGSVQSFAAAACAPQAIVCCDATVCNVPTLCVSDAPVTVSAVNPGGTWSASCGACINASTGSFNPTTAGAGTHTVTYTLPCGSESTNITVNACSALSVCSESNGNLTVSGGSSPYIWNQWSTGSTITVTNTATCTQCGGSWNTFIGQCTSGGFPPTPITSCTTPAGYVQFGTGATVTPPNPLTYPIQVTDNSGGSVVYNSAAGIQPCSSTPSCPVVTLSKTDPTCSGGANNGSVTLSFTGGTAPFTITVDTGGTPITVTVPVNPGPYTVSNIGAGAVSVNIQDAGSCSVNSSTTLITPNCCTINLAVSATQPSCGLPNGSLTITPSPAGSYSYTWTGGLSNQASQANLASGQYPVTITNTAVTGCNKDTILTLNSSSGVSVALGNLVNPTCVGGSHDGSATMTITGGTAPYTITIDTGGTPITQMVPINPGPYTVSNLGAVTVSVSIQDANSCTASANASLTAPNCCFLTATFSTTQPACGAADGSIDVTPSPAGSYSYNWQDGSNLQNRTGLAAASYPLTITDNSNPTCTFDTVIILNSNSSLSVGLTHTDPTCTGGGTDGTATLTISGGTIPYTVTIDTGGTPIVQTVPIDPFSFTLTNLGAVTANVSVEDANSCTAGATTTLLAPNCCNINLAASGTQPSCGLSNGSLNVSVTPSGNYSYTWSGGLPSQPNQSNLNGGQYPLTITDLNLPGCEKDTILTLNNSTAVSITISNPVNPTCSGSDGSATITITGGTAPFTIVVDTGGTPFTINVPINPGPYTISNLNAGTININLTDAAGCTATTSASLAAPTGCCTIALSAVLTQPSCGASDGSIQITMTSGSGNYSYNWNGLGTTNSLSNLSVGNYPLTVTDNTQSCSLDTIFSLNSSNAPVINGVTIVNESCTGAADGRATISVSGGSGGYTYVWGNGVTSTSATATGLAAGTYPFTVTDGAGCQAVGVADVGSTLCCTLAASASITNGSCNQNNAFITVNVPIAGTAPYTYSLDGGSFQSSNVFSNLSAGIYSIITRDANGCQDTVSAVVPPSSSELTITLNSTGLCVGSGNNGTATALPNGTAPYSYSWNTADTTQTINNLAPGTYNVTATDVTGCSGTAAVTINEPVQIVLNIGADTILCADQPLILNAGGNYNVYAWSTGDSTATIAPHLTGMYTVSVVDTNGCSATENIHITFQDPEVNLGDDISAFIGSYVYLSAEIHPGATSLSSYLWLSDTSINCSTCPVIRVMVVDSLPHTYQLIYTDRYGCVDSDAVTIYALPEGNVYFPSAFTPNGDNINDTYRPFGNNIRDISFKIFNRWGEKVFDSHSENIGWDGTFKGAPQSPGIYIYYAVVTFLDESRKEFKGTISLIR